MADGGTSSLWKQLVTVLQSEDSQISGISWLSAAFSTNRCFELNTFPEYCSLANKSNPLHTILNCHEGSRLFFFVVQCSSENDLTVVILKAVFKFEAIILLGHICYALLYGNDVIYCLLNIHIYRYYMHFKSKPTFTVKIS